MHRRQAGLTTVEFAVCGLLLLTVIFGCIEISRAMFVWNTITEATRRGARIAAVCPIVDAGTDDVRPLALFLGDGGGDESPILKGLTADNISVAYLASDGSTGATYDNAAYVRVSISGYDFSFAIPLIGGTVTVPPFSTTLPTESLGYVPGAAGPECPGA